MLRQLGRKDLVLPFVRGSLSGFREVGLLVVLVQVNELAFSPFVVRRSRGLDSNESKGDSGEDVTRWVDREEGGRNAGNGINRGSSTVTFIRCWFVMLWTLYV